MKKVTILILILAALLLLSACGKTDSDGKTNPPETATAEPGTTEASAETSAPAAEPSETLAEVVSSADPMETALLIGGIEHSLSECSYYFFSQYNQFVQSYGDFAIYYGLDISTGVEGLADQACDYSSDGTWYGYFLDSAISYLQEEQSMIAYAAANGITRTEEDEQTIENELQQLEADVQNAGYLSLDDFFEQNYGCGINTDTYRTALEDAFLANRVYDGFVNGLQYSDDEVDAYAAEAGYGGEDYAYPLTAMRHILFMAEPDEAGEYTEDAIAAAHSKAETLYAEWLSGEQTEERFAELANTWSEDGGSNQNGGLYEDIYQGQMVSGINDWLFGADRALGDTAIIDNNGSYVGTHIVYFAGYGELYSRTLARDEMLYSAISEWIEEQTEKNPVVPGPAYDQIGLG